ncbi:MAG: tetratricopeptide repeat protein [Acidobacteria bacterium]|nr:tetratricopeptide repeat protein [Acidobacteriota bacterium]
MRLFALSCLMLLGAVSVTAQSPADLIQRGDEAARQDRHDAAIEAYEAAVELDPAIRPDLLLRIGRQQLWAGHTEEAAEILGSFVDLNPDHCAGRNDLGLALAWGNRLTEALEQYRFVAGRCPDQRMTALLRTALVLRWLDRPAEASDAYEQVSIEGNAADRREAETGLGFIALLLDRNRSAFRRFLELYDPSTTDGAAEGLAISNYRLGRVAAARGLIRAAEDRGDLSRDLLNLRQSVESFDRWQVRSDGTVFEDGDGTGYRGGKLGLSKGWDLRGRAELATGRSTLENGSDEIAGTWVELTGEHRWSDSGAARARLRRSSFDTGWDPWSGELHWIATPDDNHRFDVAVARLLVTDNLAAIENDLRGDFLSAGFDRDVGYRFTLSASGDLTRWSAGNERARIRASVAKIFDGVPRMTVSWPTMVQWYDEPFPFRLWSPEYYVETGPGVNVYRRWKQVWNVSAYGRTGVQKEEDQDWRVLGVARVAVERDLRDSWALRLSAGWSNSNAAGSGGFRRSSAQLELVRRF